MDGAVYEPVQLRRPSPQRFILFHESCPFTSNARMSAASSVGSGGGDLLVLHSAGDGCVADSSAAAVRVGSQHEANPVGAELLETASVDVVAACRFDVQVNLGEGLAFGGEEPRVRFALARTPESDMSGRGVLGLS